MLGAFVARADWRDPSRRGARLTEVTYLHSMQTKIEGIRAVAPPRWRSLDGVVGVHWDAEAHAGASGYYISPDPRIMLFFNSVSDQVRAAHRQEDMGRNDRGLAKILFIPAGMPLWTRFTQRHRFSHLDLHLHQDRLMRYLTPTVGASQARATLKKPIELQESEPLTRLADLVTGELSGNGRNSAFAESLVGSIVIGLLEPEATASEARPAAGRLTQAQLNRLSAHFALIGEHRLTVAEMAEVVGLSESWFATVFRETTGKTPLQWQLQRRIEAAQALLGDASLTIADIAAQLGFSDQAHLTKVFRQVVGETPAAWRRGREDG